MPRTILICIALLMASILFAQKEEWQVIIAENVPEGLAMNSMLYQVARLAEEAGRDAALAKAAAFGSPVRSDGAIYVEAVMTDPASRPTVEEMRSIGVVPELIWRNIVASFIQLDRLIPVARALKGSGHLRSTTTKGDDFEGQGVQNATSYVNAGRDGSGITIGLIDRNYGQLNATILAGQAPTDIDTISIPATFNMEFTGANEHGTGCLEAIFDNAPGASYVVCRIVGDAAFGAAVDSLVAKGAHIISTSAAGYNKGWADDSGPWCDAWNDACNAGVLCFNSAGNSAMQHWQGTFTDNGNGAHRWSGTDTTNTFTLGTSSPSDRVDVYLQWASTNPGDQYDLFLYRTSNNVLLASGNASSGFEYFSYTNPSSTNNLSVYLVVRKNVANPPQFEVFASQQNLTYRSATSSTRSPTNCTHANSLSVGAVSWGAYGSAPGSNVIQNYSSLGPTNSGNQAPDLCGPTNTSSLSNPPTFGGTSCATPNAAGAAAALWSAHPYLNADAIRMLLLRLAELHRDWGAPGTDMTYGHGGLFLKTYTPDTRYILEGSGNTNGTSALPYSSMQQANQYAPLNSNTFFLGGAYNAPPVNTVLDRPMIFRSVVVDAVVE